MKNPPSRHLSILVFLVAGFALSLPVKGQHQSAVAPVNLDSLAAHLAGDGGTGFDRAELILRKLSSGFSWLSTDYQKRTIQEIIARGGGNCFELARVFMDLVSRQGIVYRGIAEVNIHPVSDRRQESAERRIAESGNRMSVFGRQHNDHRWVEIYDERTGEWIPADPSMGVIGLEEWLKARVWFGERKTIDTSITNNMLVPVGIFVVDSMWLSARSRTEHYLVESFDWLYDGELTPLPSWRRWKEQLQEVEPAIQSAFRGTGNLHDSEEDIAALWRTYVALRREYETAFEE